MKMKMKLQAVAVSLSKGKSFMMQAMFGAVAIQWGTPASALLVEFASKSLPLRPCFAGIPGPPPPNSCHNCKSKPKPKLGWVKKLKLKNQDAKPGSVCKFLSKLVRRKSNNDDSGIVCAETERNSNSVPLKACLKAKEEKQAKSSRRRAACDCNSIYVTGCGYRSFGMLVTVALSGLLLGRFAALACVVSCCYLVPAMASIPSNLYSSCRSFCASYRCLPFLNS